MAVLNISESVKGPAIWQLAFRPFFLSGALFGVFALMVWGLFLNGVNLVPGGSLSPAQWHGHEMLFGFGLAIVYGFLLTAVQTWTGVPAVKGTQLILLWSLWLLARLLWLLPGEGVLVWVAAVDLAFQLLGLFWLLRPVILVKQWRNIAVAVVPLLMMIANGRYYLAAADDDYLQQQHSLQAMIWLFAVMMSVIGGRVIPFFTANKLGVQQAKKHLWLELGCHLSLLLLALQTLLGFGLPQVALLALAVTSFLFHVIRWCSWQATGLWRVPLLWSLHIAYLFVPLFTLAWGLSEPLSWWTSDVLHLLAIGAISGMILAMISRVSLGHTGRELRSSLAINTAFVLVTLSALARFAPALLPAWRLPFYNLSALTWTLAFVIFLIGYWRILTSKRVDGRPG
ncbi:NnrS family protein [Porticoccus sp. W117]|uniref:NnrS family protein n=1 Tax=Porticoccus sp. W117 TaxID=3054777 RepID=UPI002591D555|nr:NnrS family protein [Porticoccus sp. W117]MDM3871164.1 NnrS family protein [Porticoccus sp. W117]